MSRHGRPRRGRAGWWVLAAFFALPMLGTAMYGDGATGGGMGGMPMGWHESADRWLGSEHAQILSVAPLQGTDVAAVQPASPTYAVPPGTTRFRVEVAGGGPRASLHVIAETDDRPVPDLTLPFAVDVEVSKPGALRSVIANGPDAGREIQCRVYANEDLVAIATGHGTVECHLPST